MKRILFCLCLTLVTIVAQAQEPAWLDPVNRAKTWPTEDFLTAFATEVMNKNQSEAEAQERLNQIVKGQLSDAIMVSINAQTELNITIENTATDQKLERRSASASDVDLVGLKLDSYFDKKKKSLYTFGYVSIDELSKFYRQQIFKNDDLIRENNNRYASTNDKSEKIKLLIDNKKILTETQKAVRLLTALSQPHGADISQLKQIATQNENRLDGLFRSGSVTITHLVTRMSGELLLALPTGTISETKQGRMPYSTSEVTSGFSNELMNQLASSLGEDPRVTFSNAGTGVMSGSFVQNESETTFNVQLKDAQARTIAVSEFGVNTDIINTQGVPLLPPNFEMIPRLSILKMEVPAQFSIKPSEYTSKPLIIECSVDNVSVANLHLDVTLEIEGKKKVYQIISAQNGQAMFNLDESMVRPGDKYLIRITPNLERYLSIAPENDYLSYIKSHQKIPEVSVDLDVLSPTVFVVSREDGFDGGLSVKVIEPALKSGLAELRYAFVEDITGADYQLSIEAIARKGQAGDVGTLAFVDATISLVDNKTGKEIYKNSFYNIKGIGANHDDAQSKAFQKARTQIVDDLTYELEYNR